MRQREVEVGGNQIKISVIYGWMGTFYFSSLCDIFIAVKKFAFLCFPILVYSSGGKGDKFAYGGDTFKLKVS